MLHLPHEHGGFGVTHNTASRHAASYTTNARFVAFLGTFALPAQQVWLPGNELNDPSTWVAPPLCTLKRLHQSLVQDFNCTDQPAAVLPSQPGAGGAAAGAGAAQHSTHWAPFKALRQRYAGAPFEQQLQLHLPQKHKATEQDSALRVEMTGLEDQADNAKPRELWWKPLSWLGTLRPTTANDAWDPAL